MNNGLDDLYREIILDHNRNPRNYGSIQQDNVISIEEYNPLCGDRIVIYLTSNSSIVESVQFEGEGCSISQASASIMTDLIIGTDILQTKKIIEQFHSFMVDNDDDSEYNQLGDIDALQGVRKFPARVKCASLAWVSLEKAISSIDN
jgi:nitrogen fixation NifU-like protein|tara:strand:+ start:12176 stop:12616 length:441 start_codon:yes stop_codon:yes gene_type:complete